jgi:hypothetical protein
MLLLYTILQALERHLGGEARLASDLQPSVDPRYRLADQAVLVH